MYQIDISHKKWRARHDLTFDFFFSFEAFHLFKNQCSCLYRI